MTVELRPEIEAKIVSRAEALGISPDDYVQELLEMAARPAIVEPPAMSIEEWEKALDEWAEESPDVPYIPNEFLRRKYLYGGY